MNNGGKTRPQAGSIARTNLRLPLALATLGLLSGCATTPPPLNFTPPNIAMSAVKHNAALISTTVTAASGAEARGRIISGTEGVVAQLWKTSLEDSLIRMAMFRDDAPMRLALVVKILQMDVPTMGLTMVTQATARYELIDRNTGAVVYTTDVHTEGRSPVGDDFMGANRVRISLANAAQTNIADFLRQLETADLTKPMFPAQKQVAAGAAK